MKNKFMGNANIVYIGVGSNIQPEINIPASLEKIMDSDIIANKTRPELSSHYITRPVHGADDPDFVNGVWKITTEYAYSDLKDKIKSVESELGRVRRNDKNAAREIDLDILIFNDMVDSKVSIPDPEIYKREFLYIPILEIDPDIVIPGDNKPLSEYIDNKNHGMILSPITYFLLNNLNSYCSGGTAQ